MVTRSSLLAVLNGVTVPTKLIKEDQSTKDIMKQILRKHSACTGQYDLIAYQFAGGDQEDICRRLFNFCKKQIRYEEESTDGQYASAPVTILRRGYADCKGYALFIGGILDALNRKGENFDWCYRFATDKLFRYLPSHVFIVVKTDQAEIWIDPVLSNFNYHKWYFFHVDRQPKNISQSGSSKIGCAGSCNCGCDSVGRIHRRTLSGGRQRIGTAATTGAMISKVAPALTAIPVAGVFLAIGGELVGLFLQIFGNKYTTSTKVRWLTQTYQYRVLNQSGVTSDNKVNEGYTQDAQKWFYAVIGVPIYDICRFHTLRGENCDTGQSLGWTDQQAAQQYLAYGEVQKAGITMQEALQAVSIARSMRFQAGDPAGIWATLPFSPYLADRLNAQAQAQAQAGGAPGLQTVSPGLLPTGSNLPGWLLPAAAAGAILLLVNSK